MTIRQATPHDAFAIARVVHAMGDLRAVAQQAPEATAKAIAANLARMVASGGSAAYVAEEPGGKMVGYGAVHWVPFLFFPGGEAYVTELFICPSHSGKGAGTRLLDVIVSEAKKRGCSRVSLLNGRDGEAYRRAFYKKRGWKERERMANFILPLANASESTAASGGDGVTRVDAQERAAEG